MEKYYALRSISTPVGSLFSFLFVELLLVVMDILVFKYDNRIVFIIIGSCILMRALIFYREICGKRGREKVYMREKMLFVGLWLLFWGSVLNLFICMILHQIHDFGGREMQYKVSLYDDKALRDTSHKFLSLEGSYTLSKHRTACYLYWSDASINDSNYCVASIVSSDDTDNTRVHAWVIMRIRSRYPYTPDQAFRNYEFHNRLIRYNGSVYAKFAVDKACAQKGCGQEERDAPLFFIIDPSQVQLLWISATVLISLQGLVVLMALSFYAFAVFCFRKHEMNSVDPLNP